MATAGTLEYLISINSSQVNSGLNSADKKVKGFGDKMSKWAVAKGQVLGRMIEKAGQATMQFVKGSVQESMSFDKSMAQVAATMGKTINQMDGIVRTTTYTVMENGQTVTKKFTGNLKQFAREMGATTAFSAQQAAEGLNYMALAGYDAQTSMEMLPQVLNLAAAGSMDLGRASDMVTDAASALGMTLADGSVDAERVGTMIDQMAQTASKSNTSVEQLGDAILTVGGTAKIMGKDTDMLNATLGILADNGIKGSEGGTALRNVLLSLSAPTDKAKKQLKSLGVEVFDSAGNMRSMEDIMLDMGDAMKGMTDEQRTSIISDIFNKRDLKSVEALLGTSKSRWEELLGSIGGSKGAAAKMADTQLDNLAGDVTKFKSALGEAKLTIVEGLTPSLRKLTQIGTKAVSRLAEAFKKKGLKGAIEEAGTMFKDFIKNLKSSNNKGLNALGNGLEFVSGAISSIYNLITDWDGTVEKLKGSGQPIQIALGTALEGIKEAFNTISNLVTNWDGTIASMKDSGEPFKIALGTALEGIASAFGTIGDLVNDWDGTIAKMNESDGTVLPLLASALSGIKDTINAIIDAINGKWGDAVRTLRDSDNPVVSTIGEAALAFDNAKNKAQEYIDKANEALGATGRNGKVYEGFARRMAQSFGEITDEAGLNEWIRQLSNGLTDAGVSADKVLTIGKYLKRQAESGASQSDMTNLLLQLAGIGSPYGLADLVNTMAKSNEAAEQKPIEVPVEPEPVQPDIIAQNLGLQDPIEVHVQLSEEEFNEQVKANIEKLKKEASNEALEFEVGVRSEAPVGTEMGVFGSHSSKKDQKQGVYEVPASFVITEESKETVKQEAESNPVEMPVETELDKAKEKSTFDKLQRDANAAGVTIPIRPVVQGGGAGAGVGAGFGFGSNGGGGGITPAFFGAKPFFAKGNWNVPYDNYPALLHRGEMVLNKSQARQFRDGEFGGGFSAGESVSAAVEKAMSRVFVMLNGDKVGDLTTKRINKNINASSYNKLRAMGG